MNRVAAFSGFIFFSAAVFAAPALPPIEKTSDRISVAPLDPRTQEIKKKFDAYIELTKSLDQILDRMAQHYTRMTFGAASEVHESIIDRVVPAFERLSGDKTFRVGIETIWTQIHNEVPADADSALSAANLERMFAPDKPSLYNVLYYLKRHGSLRLLESLQASVPGNAAVEYMGVNKPPLYALELSPGPGLSILSEAIHGMDGAKDWSYIVSGPAILGELRAGDRNADVFVRLGPAGLPGSGSIRINYRELGHGFGPEARLRFLAGALYQAGFAVDARNGVLTGVLDAGDKNLRPEDVSRAAVFALRAFVLTDRLDRCFVLLAMDGPSDAEFNRHLDNWAGILLAQGQLPFYLYGQPEATVKGYKDLVQDGSIHALLGYVKKSAPVFLETSGLKASVPIRVDEWVSRAKRSADRGYTVTFDRDKADADHLLIVPNASDPDYLGAVSRAGGLIIAGGRLSDPLPNKAIRSGTAAVFIRSELAPTGLPVHLRIGPHWMDAVLREGSRVRMNPSAGKLEWLPTPRR